ncbi:MAG: VOC family protein [Pyrinomonadaceae bacterium]
MKIKLSSVMVDDQEKARDFYTRVLGFEIKMDVPMGNFNWLTVVSPNARDEAELLLEPTNFPPSRTFQNELYMAGIAARGFFVDDVQAEYERLLELGVEFRHEPVQMGPATVATFDDTCGNWIEIYHL